MTVQRSTVQPLFQHLPESSPTPPEPPRFSLLSVYPLIRKSRGIGWTGRTRPKNMPVRPPGHLTGEFATGAAQTDRATLNDPARTLLNREGGK